MSHLDGVVTSLVVTDAPFRPARVVLAVAMLLGCDSASSQRGDGGSGGATAGTGVAGSGAGGASGASGAGGAPAMGAGGAGGAPAMGAGGAVLAVSVGSDVICTLMTGGNVDCWGNVPRSAGLPSPADAPIAVPGVSGALAVAAGSGRFCILKSDRTVQCWSSPAVVSHTFEGVTNVKSIALEDKVMPLRRPADCALLEDTTASCFPHTEAQPLAGLTGVTFVGKSDTFACALLSDGRVKCWGNNEEGQLGDGTTVSATTPVDVVGLTGVTALSVGYRHACAIVAGGVARCWGSNYSGQLGTGNLTGAKAPAPVVGLSGALAIAAGTIHTCALLSDHTVTCWGGNLADQLGTGAAGDPVVTPISVSNVSAATSISAGASYTCVTLVDGRAKCWGNSLGGHSLTAF